MTDTDLQSLGFTSTDETRSASRSAFSQAWRYQHSHMAQDGAVLYIEHPLGIDSCRLSALVAPLAAQDVFASVSLHDRAALQAAIAAFFAAHGGEGQLVPTTAPPTLRPQRRGL